MTTFSLVFGSPYDERAPGNGWKCRKCLEQATACLGHNRGFLVATKFFSTGLGLDKGFLGCDRPPGCMSRHGFPCVAIELSLSR